MAELAAFSGRHHGLSPVDFYRLVAAVERPKDAASYIAETIAAGKMVPGFGHRLYSTGDPRVETVLSCARTLAGERGGVHQRRMETVVALMAAGKDQGLPPPNFDFALVAVAAALGLGEMGASKLFVVGRMAGWTAHVLEQRQQDFMLRPRARYVGRAPLE